MRAFNYDFLEELSYPMETLRLISRINEYKGKQDLYIRQAPELLNTLRSVAVIQSTKASNAIEGIIVTDKRLKSIMDKSTEPMDRSEGEIAGYRDVLDLIHSSHEAITIEPNVLLQLHRMIYKYLSFEGGSWKNSDNVITETLPTREKRIRFQPTSAFETPKAMEELCFEFKLNRGKDHVEPLILIAVFVLDFLCIHPFNDGNVRMARLLTLLLLYHFGYEVGRYISLEKIIEDTKEGYYESLRISSMDWHENKNNIFPWIHYLLGTIIAAYKQLEDRVGLVESKKGGKSERVERFIENKIGFFTKEDIKNACPDVSESTITRVLQQLKSNNRIEISEHGRNAKWRKT
ncbi:Fic family protein [Jeotgalibacillus aurantiacus]|uniref:Fic family protein n=1 Tax=Jeotgalibacillus aurantiacus TaxID=2763266 RepID=UPI001D09ECC8|nr:Fic family protein [Jeotgalibacillus aurantiacus]